MVTFFYSQLFFSSDFFHRFGYSNFAKWKHNSVLIIFIFDDMLGVLVFGTIFSTNFFFLCIQQDHCPLIFNQSSACFSRQDEYLDILRYVVSICEHWSCPINKRMNDQTNKYFNLICTEKNGILICRQITKNNIYFINNSYKQFGIYTS